MGQLAFCIAALSLGEFSQDSCSAPTQEKVTLQRTAEQGKVLEFFYNKEMI